ncbi:hypothetical protein ACX80O_14915 [Arthrobacter sp. Hz1]
MTFSDPRVAAATFIPPLASMTAIMQHRRGSPHIPRQVFGIARDSFADYAVEKANHLTPAPPEPTDVVTGKIAIHLTAQDRP